ncbi:MAG TPA: hypothetical protein VLQ68_04625 [Rhizobiaceae bacterium]|nr:hypothetical protein [Rhizobiaceae bacterium]
MKKLSRSMAITVASAALYAAAALVVPATGAWLGMASMSLAKDGGNSGSGGGDDGGNSGSGGGDDGGNSGRGGGDDSGGDDHDNSGSGSGDDSGDDSNSGSGSDDDADDSDDNDDNGRSGRSGRSGNNSERPEVEVKLTREQLAGVQAGTLKLVDNLGRVLELEIENEHGVTTVSAKPHGGDSRRNPGPITSINVVPAGSVSNSVAGDDDGTPDQGPGDN